MNTTTLTIETIRELMAAYDQKRAEWIKAHGTAAGFDRWFTTQALGA